MSSPEKKRSAAVAIRYRPGEDDAPQIVASGFGEIARKILELAETHNVPIYEKPEIVESLAKLEVGTDIPPQFYQVVAEILAFVYSVDRKWEQRKN